jgi:hypothetical protein
MTDTITLPRAVVEQVWEALMGIPADQHRVNAALIDLEAALAEPEQPQKARPDFLERVEDTVEENDDAKRD